METISGKTILIVDDEKLNRDLLEAFVVSFGHEPLCAEDGYQAVSMMDATIDLVLMDIMMPGMDGIETTRTIRLEKAYADIPIIMVTALDRQEERLKSVKAGANDFIAKPVDRTELHVRMTSLLKMKSARDEVKRYNEKLEETVKERTLDLSRKNAELEREIQERKQIEAELKKMSMAIEESINLAFITNAKGVIEYVNPMFEKVTGYSKAEVIGTSPALLASGETPDGVYNDMWQTITAGHTWRGEFKNKNKNGQHYWSRGLISPIQSDSGEITHFLAIQEDITEKIMTEKKARYLATHDKTTGLINRERFINSLKKYLEMEGHGIVMIVDVDDFKLINDAYGHHFADGFLQRIVALVKEELNNFEGHREFIMGRYGDDEFIVLIPWILALEGEKIAESIRKKVELFTFMKDEARTTLSVGIVKYPEHGINVRELLNRLEAALLRAKEYGKNRTHLFTDQDEVAINQQPRLKQKVKILKALDEDRFVPWFQPILDLKDEKVHHYEVLARMQEPDGKIVMPGEFILAAEIFGLIADIDRTITKKTIDLQARIKTQHPQIRFAMNLSGKHLGDMALLNFLRVEIEKSGADPSHLVFEITETAAIQHLDLAVEFIDALKSMGCQFSLDDFGVGFTSFVYLREMQVDLIKIDGQFIRRLHERTDDQAIVKAIITVAKDMGIKTVAEFVEQEITLTLLKELGVDYAQGYLIGKPAPKIDGVIES